MTASQPLPSMPLSPAPKKKAWWKTTPAIAGVSLLLGVGLGNAAGGGGSGAAAPAPAPTVTVTAPAPAPEPVPTVTVTAEATQTETIVEKTPESCLKALDLAGEIMDAVATEHLEMSEAAFTASQTGDVITFAERISEAMGKLTDTSNRLQPQVLVAASDCRSKA
ncbi:MAG: hypothetical protein GX632_01340 [Propioniciclava sp.]|nr:hypothetical protein [Propioniciclava sp.]